MTQTPPHEMLIEAVDQSGILVIPKMPRFFNLNKDFVFPYFIFVLVQSGSARSMYDMHVTTYKKNDLVCIMPGHILHPIDCTDDFSYALMFISPKMLDELRFHTFSHDYEKFNYAHVFSLTDEQASHMQAIVNLLAVIATRTDEEMPHRHQALMAQLAVNYEFLSCYRREQDKQWIGSRHMEIFDHFCNLVAKHYRESREVKYYANKLNLTPKYLNKVVRQATEGLSPGEWIDQYVTTQAKRLIETQATETLKETAYLLGFSAPSSFYRYFKRITGMTAKEYRYLHRNHHSTQP